MGVFHVWVYVSCVGVGFRLSSQFCMNVYFI